MTGLAEPSAADCEVLAAITGPAGVVEDTRPYLVEPRDRWPGRTAIVLRPGSTEEVSRIVRHCAGRRLAIVPWSGGTGLVGGQVMGEGPKPVLLSTERLNRIRAILPDDDALVAEGGAILTDIHAAAEAADRLFPLSLGSQGSARIGGLLSTNAGGVQVLRYGPARALCLGIEAVLPDGSVMAGLKPLRKDNTGYSLRDLLIGAEGTLGIITAATLRLFPRPGETVTAMLAVPSPEAALMLLRRMRSALGDAVTAFELMARQGPDWVRAFWPERPVPLPDALWRVLVEAVGPAAGGLGERVEAVLAAAFEEGVATDGVVAGSEAQRAGLWWLREAIPEANRRVGALVSHDIALSTGDIPRFIEAATAAVVGIDPGVRINCFGHLGDGNLHFNMFPPEGASVEVFVHLAALLQRAVHDLVHELGGSFSAEHGVGRAKVAELERYGDPARLAAMRAIKRALDPAGIMNPGAVLRAE